MRNFLCLLLLLGLLSACGTVDRHVTVIHPLDARAWEVRDEGGDAYVALVAPGKLRPGVRRPAEYALLGNNAWRNVTVRCRVKSLLPEDVVGRDAVILVGYQDDTHFYYAHISNDSDGKVHNVIMKVDGNRRERINIEEKPEPRLLGGWHDVQVSHSSDGAIRVWVDDMTKPLMTATDRSFLSGRVGIGSFNDPAAFDDLEVDGEIVAEE